MTAACSALRRFRATRWLPGAGSLRVTHRTRGVLRSTTMPELLGPGAPNAEVRTMKWVTADLRGRFLILTQPADTVRDRADGRYYLLFERIGERQRNGTPPQSGGLGHGAFRSPPPRRSRRRCRPSRPETGSPRRSAAASCANTDATVVSPTAPGCAGRSTSVLIPTRGHAPGRRRPPGPSAPWSPGDDRDVVARLATAAPPSGTTWPSGALALAREQALCSKKTHGIIAARPRRIRPMTSAGSTARRS